VSSQKVQISKVIETAKDALRTDDTFSDSAKVVISSLIDIVGVISSRLGLNSSNSSKPPSMDPNRARKTRTTKGKRRKPGGQAGHTGSRLEPIENPTVVEELLIDRRTLPPGKWKFAGFDKRQVFDIWKLDSSKKNKNIQHERSDTARWNWGLVVGERLTRLRSWPTSSRHRGLTLRPITLASCARPCSSESAQSQSA
jgi:hypothetical protein